VAKFLDTTGISYHLEQLIKHTTQQLVLISPYLRINDRIRELLEDRDRLKQDVRVVYGKNELQPDEIEWLGRLRSVRLCFCKNLHAKCYLNDDEAIVTSMNLYEFSQVNNNEMGIHVTKAADPELYKDISDEVHRLVRISEEHQLSVAKVSSNEVPPNAEATRAQPSRGAKGHCIRCGKSIALNPAKPYCPDDYKEWAIYSKDTYKDRFCHRCGKEHPATMRKPLCPDCYAAKV